MIFAADRLGALAWLLALTLLSGALLSGCAGSGAAKSPPVTTAPSAPVSKAAAPVPARPSTSEPAVAESAERPSLAALPPAETGVPDAIEERITDSFTGLASWYGKRFHGRLTASGSRFDMGALTAAHRSLPFGTRVRVTNLANQRSVVVTINDRGPFVKPRVIDLSRAAAEMLGFIDDGLAKVRVDVLAPAQN